MLAGVGAAGVIAVMAFIVATLLSDWAQAAQAAIALLFGENPLAALFAEATAMFALASFALGKAIDALESMGYRRSDDSLGGRILRSFEDFKKSVDGVMYILAFATAATTVVPLLLAITATGATAATIVVGILGIIIVVALAAASVDAILSELAKDLSEDSTKP